MTLSNTIEKRIRGGSLMQLVAFGGGVIGIYAAIPSLGHDIQLGSLYGIVQASYLQHPPVSMASVAHRRGPP